MLQLFFDISTSFRFSKDQCECTLHSEAPPWLDLLDLAQFCRPISELMILQGHIIHHHPFVQQIRSIFLLFYKTVAAFLLGSVYLPIWFKQELENWKHWKANLLFRSMYTYWLKLWHFNLLKSTKSNKNDVEPFHDRELERP